MILDERRVGRSRASSGSMADSILSSIKVSGGKVQAVPFSNQWAEDDIDAKGDGALAEVAMSLTNEVNGYLESINDSHPIQQRLFPSVQQTADRAFDNERIGTPVKIKKQRSKSPGTSDPPPLSLPKVERSVSKESNDSFEFDENFLKELAQPSPDKKSSSMSLPSQEPDLSVLLKVAAEDQQNDDVFAKSGSSSEPPSTSRDGIPALSIFNTVASVSTSSKERSSSNSSKERSSSTEQSKILSGPAKRRSTETPPTRHETPTESPTVPDVIEVSSIPGLKKVVDFEDIYTDKPTTSGSRKEGQSTFGIGAKPKVPRSHEMSNLAAFAGGPAPRVPKSTQRDESLVGHIPSSYLSKQQDPREVHTEKRREPKWVPPPVVPTTLPDWEQASRTFPRRGPAQNGDTIPGNALQSQMMRSKSEPVERHTLERPISPHWLRQSSSSSQRSIEVEYQSLMDGKSLRF